MIAFGRFGGTVEWMWLVAALCVPYPNIVVLIGWNPTGSQTSERKRSRAVAAGTVRGRRVEALR